MKKVVLILLLVLCIVSCSNNTVESTVPPRFSSITYFEYSGHKYILFTLDRALPASSANIVHDPDCPCHKKDTVYIRGKSSDVNITYREKTIQDDILKFLVDEVMK